MLTATNLSKAHGPRTLFRDVGVRLLSGKRLAIVGGNGVGKTTLLEILAGVQDADEGTVTVDRGVRIGYLPQEVMIDPDSIVLQEVLSGAAEVQELGRRIEVLHERMQDEHHDEILEEYGHLEDQFRNAGGYELEATAQRVLAGLGFGPDDGNRRIGELSGGWGMRVALARLLMTGADVLFLDEPTNHLDIASIDWLTQTLRDRSGALLLVSHDRDFIDDVASHVLELRGGRAEEYVGGFAAFVEEREARIAQARAVQRQQDKEIERLGQFVERFRYTASKAKQAQSKLNQIGRMQADRVQVHDKRTRTPRFAFPDPPRVGRVVLECHDLTVRFGEQTVLDGMDLVVERGRKVALVGPNGAGKSTLLKVVAGVLDPTDGTVTLGHNVEPAYFAQHQVEALDLNATVLDTARAAFDGDAERAKSARTYLGAFGFTGEAAEHRVGALSGGERTRLALACLLAVPRSLLVLDEPTNHLDIASRDVLEDALTEYEGTVLLVTHDRHLIRNVADMIVEVLPGRLRAHDMTWEEYIDRTGGLATRVVATAAGAGVDAASRTVLAGADAPRAAVAPAPLPEQPASRDRTAKDRGGRKRLEAELRNRLYRETRDLRNDVERAESEIDKAEAQLAVLTRRMADPGLYDDAAVAKDVVAQHAAAKEQLARHMDRWEAASARLEQTTTRIEAELHDEGW